VIVFRLKIGGVTELACVAFTGLPVRISFVKLLLHTVLSCLFALSHREPGPSNLRPGYWDAVSLYFVQREDDVSKHVASIVRSICHVNYSYFESLSLLASFVKSRGFPQICVECFPMNKAGFCLV
jgi:hypothetical protein